MITQAGIYQIRNLVNGHVYIGSTVRFYSRRSAHKRDLERGTHHSERLQRAWAKYGKAAFKFEPLIVCGREHLIFYEQLLIDALAPEYNMCKVAGSCLGNKLSEEHKRKIGAAHKGRVTSPETRRKMSIAALGRKKSAEAREAMSQGQRLRLPETRPRKIPLSDAPKVWEMGRSGATLQQIARMYGATHQGVSSFLKTNPQCGTPPAITK
jgi:group I intron endonuclease